ncbi:hypothetical protein TYRP_000099 [Tyrophagus putrescentiae]|nr:hypothetical protein TYRP_000099 [Tyrophagus putrescentiae]
MDNTLSPFDISAKHRIVSPSTSSVNQPPRKRHHSDSTSSSDKSSSDDSSDNSDSDSSSSSSSSSSSNRSRVSHRSRKSNSSRSSSDDSRPNSSCSSHSEEEVEKSKVKKAFKKPQQIIAETIRDSMVFPKTTAATSKKAKQPNDSAISSSNNTSNESLHSSSIDKSSSNGRTKSDIFSDKGKASKSAKQSRTNVPSSKKDLSHNSSASSLGYTSSTKPPASSDSKSMSVLKSDGSDDETSEYSKRSKKSQKSSKPKKSANASSSVNSNRSSKKITSNKYVISGSSDESSDEKCPTDASDDEKSKYKSEDDSDNDFEFKKKSAKMTFNKKSTTEKKPKAVARSRTTSSSSSRKKSVSDESKPIIIPSGRRSPVKKELPQQTTASIKGKPLAKDAFTDPPVPASARARRTSASRSPAKSKMKISAPQTADLKPDVENMETDAVFVGESDSNTMSSPLRPHRGALKAAPPFVVNHHDSRVMSPSVNDDSTMSSVLSPPHSYRSSFMSPSGRSAMEHSGLNIHIPVKTGATTKEPPVASQRISPRIAALNEARPPPQMANLFVPRTIEELIEFQTVNTTNFLLSREENRDIAALMRQLNSLIQENSQTERSIESLSKELNCLMTLNKELKGVEITSSTSIISKRSQAAELTLNGVNGEALGRSRALTATSGIGSLVTTPSLSSSELDSQSSCSMPTSHPTTFTSILNSKPSATPTLISSLNSVTPLAPTTTTASSMIYSSSSHQPLSTTTLQNANTSMANILAANNHFSQHGQQAPYNQPFVLNSNHATNASTSRSRQGEINLSASLSASLYASAGVHHQPPQQVTPLGSHLHGQVPGGHPLDNLTNPAILNQLNHLVTTGQVPTGALRHSASYQQLIGASAQYEQHQQQHSASNGSNINGRHAPLTRRNSGNSAAALNHHHSMANGVGTGTSSTSASNRPYENSLGHASTNGGPNSAHFYNHN